MTEHTVTVEGRTYLVHLAEAHAPLYDTRVWRIRKDGERGREISPHGDYGIQAVTAAIEQRRGRA